MKRIFVFLVLLGLSGCNHAYLMRDCVLEGTGPYSKCHKIHAWDVG